MSAEAPINVLADTHCHYYPEYNLEIYLRSAFANLNRIADGLDAYSKAIYLCDRAGQANFSAIFARTDAFKQSAFELLDVDKGLVSRVENENNDVIRIVNGRQLVSREKIEVLALAMTAELRDGMPLHDTIKSVRDAGGLPVLSWSPGKWWFERGRVVLKLIETASRGDFVLGDVAMRCALFPQPAAFGLAKEKGIGLLAGTDPLPRSADQSLPGSYATLFTNPGTDLRTALQSTASICGSRNGICHGLQRLISANVGIC